MKKKPEEYSSVRKAIEILMAFTPHNQDMGTLELSQKLGIHKSSVSRLLGVLTYHGLLQQDPITKKYKLGKVTAEISTTPSRHVEEGITMLIRTFKACYERVLKRLAITERFWQPVGS